MAERVSVVILAYGEEPWLARSVASALAAHPHPVHEVLLVDNGAAQAVAAVPADPRLRVLRPAANAGFAGGCNLAARRATGDVLVFLNSDAWLAPDAVAHLVAALRDPDVALATACVRLAQQPTLVNAAGNPAQFLAFSWAGGLGEPAAEHATAYEPASVSGACFAVRSGVWRSLGGFDGRYFAYGEDLELSWRAWQQGWRVRYVPEAVAEHHYEQSRNPYKRYLLERNRWVTVLTMYDAATLRLVLPALLAVEVGVTATAVRQGWLRRKVDAWEYVWERRAEIRARRRLVQASRTRSDAELHALLRGPVDPPAGAGVAVPAAANRLLAAYWAWVGRRIGAPGATRP